MHILQNLADIFLLSPVGAHGFPKDLIRKISFVSGAHPAGPPRFVLLHVLVPRAVHDLLEHLVEHVLLGLAGAVGRLPHVHLVSEKGEKQALLWQSNGC